MKAVTFKQKIGQLIEQRNLLCNQKRHKSAENFYFNYLTNSGQN